MSTQNAHAYILQLTAATVPSMRYDGIQPFDAWQHTAREKLGELLGLPLLKGSDEIHILRKSRGESFTRTDFTFESEPGYEVSAAFLCPDNMQQPLPVVICLQGHSTGMHISLGEPHYERDAKSIAGGRDIALQAIRNGYCAVAIEQRYMGTSGHGETGQPSCQTHNESTAALMLGRTDAGPHGRRRKSVGRQPPDRHSLPALCRRHRSHAHCLHGQFQRRHHHLLCRLYGRAHSFGHTVVLGGQLRPVHHGHLPLPVQLCTQHPPLF